jgi:carbonic anhydrase/acetyltransferase-like protein (isoleucine patch superfamily)
MLVEHLGKSPRIHESAWVAPSATVAGDVEVGPDTRVLFGAVLTAEGGPIRIGSQSVIMENAVLRGAPRHPLTVGNHVLIGPHAYLSGCSVADEAFVATGAAVFNGASIGAKAEVRINGIVHVGTSLPDGTVVPIGWVAVGDPASILPASSAEEIWEKLRPLNFPKEVFGVDRSEEMMVDIMSRYSRSLSRHKDDRIIED